MPLGILAGGSAYGDGHDAVCPGTDEFSCRCPAGIKTLAVGPGPAARWRSAVVAMDEAAGRQRNCPPLGSGFGQSRADSNPGGATGSGGKGPGSVGPGDPPPFCPTPAGVPLG